MCFVFREVVHLVMQVLALILWWGSASGGRNKVKMNRVCLHWGVPKERTRKYMLDRSRERWSAEDVSNEEIEWIMRVEGNSTTLLLWESDPASGGAPDAPTAGGHWYIRGGKVITLAEFIYKFCDDLTMFELYRMWLLWPNLAFKRPHSESLSEKANHTRNAKELQYQEIGKYGLHAKERVQRQRRG